MKNVDVSKILFFVSSLVFAFAYGVAVGTYQIFPHTVLDYAKDSAIKVFEERRTLAKEKPEHFLQPARYSGSGVTLNKVPADREDLVFIMGFFERDNELRLIGRDGAIVARWPVRFSEIFEDASHMQNPPATDWNIDINGGLILPDGSVVFSFEYGGLVKLDRCGDLVWTLPRITHHSVERAENGGYWVAASRLHASERDSPFRPFVTPFREDTVLKVSESGRVVTEFSVPQLFYDNGLEAVLTASGHDFFAHMAWDREILHLNKVEELTSDIAEDFPMFSAGDLALSIRAMNLVMVVDPDNGTLKWWRHGPWIRQHDPEFKAGGTIVVFNNNAYRTAFGGDTDVSHVSIPRVSNIVEIDPTTGIHEVVFGGTKEQEMLSVIRGKVEVTPGGGLLITEFEAGRILETNADGDVIWEYINRYDEDEVAEVNEARVYPRDYFSVSDWSCDD